MKAAMNGAAHPAAEVLGEPARRALPGPEDLAGNLARTTALREHFQASVGEIVVAMARMPRYRDQSIGDVLHLLIEPMQRNRVAIARSTADGKVGQTAGVAIWASVSEEVDAHIREQIKAGVFPIRLKPEDWNSGDICWLLDVIAPNQTAATAVLISFRQVVQDKPVHVHPIVSRLVDPDVLETMRIRPPQGHGDSMMLH
jgi:hemolysin-activating ACP:hemolysin acyltransferase